MKTMPKQAKSAQNQANNRVVPDKKGGISAILKKWLFGRADSPQTAQQSIPYDQMCKDGICRINSRLYTKTVQFYDINYQLSHKEDQAQIFDGYCTFLNYFDSSVSVQFTFINRRADADEFAQSVEIPYRDDEFNDIRREYDTIIKNQLARGNNGIVKTKYITFGIEAEILKEAKPRLERIETDVISNFKVLGVSARPLSGYERLEILHAQFHPLNNDKMREKFHFDWSDLPISGLSTKDYIAPSGFDFRDGRVFGMGENIGAVSFLQISAPELADRLLADFLDLNTNVTVTMHIRSIDQAEAIKTVKRKLSDLDAMKISQQKKAVRAGFDMDVLPPDLVTFGKEAKILLENLQSRNERMFQITFIVMNTAKNRQKLENDIFAAAGVAQKHNCALKRLDWQQEQGLMSSLPLGPGQEHLLLA